MITRLKHGDKVIFLENLKKDGTYGDIVNEVKTYWIETGAFITEDPNLKLFPKLDELYFKQRIKGLNKSNQHFSFALVNGEYKLIKYGRTVKIMIDDLKKIYNEKWTNYEFNIVITKSGAFDNYDSCYFSMKHNQSFDESFLKTKPVYLENVIDMMCWTKDDNYEKLIEYFKNSGIKSDPIKEITIQQRELKLKRVLKEENTFSKEDLVSILTYITKKDDVEQLINEWINENR